MRLAGTCFLDKVTVSLPIITTVTVTVDDLLISIRLSAALVTKTCKNQKHTGNSDCINIRDDADLDSKPLPF